MLNNIIETEQKSLTGDFIDLFKKTIIECNFDIEIKLKKNISILISSFIKHFGIETWPEIHDLIEKNIDSDEGSEMTLNTLDIILENSQTILYDKASSFLIRIINKILLTLHSTNDDTMRNNLLNTLSIFIDNYQEIVLGKLNDIIELLLSFIVNADSKRNIKLEKCLISIMHIDYSYANGHFDDIFNFFIGNFTKENELHIYKSSEFFLFILMRQLHLKNQNIKNSLKRVLSTLIPSLLQNMKLTQTDMDHYNSKIHSDKLDNSIYTNTQAESREIKKEDSDNMLNSSITLRKNCSRVLDSISISFPDDTFIIIRPFLENDMQSKDELIKERSILALGAISQGCYQQMVCHLKTLIPFLIRELQHPNMFIRAIGCWTLSRYTKFILNDNCNENKDELFKEYLTEILKKFLDKENIVRDSAITAFHEMLNVNSNVLEPYLFDIFKIIINVFNKFSGVDLLSIYDILVILMEKYAKFFCNQSFVDEIVKCIVQKWYDLVKENDLITLPSFFDVITTLISISGNFLIEYCDYFLSGSLKLIEQNVNQMRINNYKSTELNKELLTKSLDTISIIAQHFSDYFKNSEIKNNMLDFLFEILHVKDLYILHFAIALFGDIIQVDKSIINKHINSLTESLINFIDFNDYSDINQSEKLSVCNNSIWTIGLIMKNYNKTVSKYIDDIMAKIVDILKLNKINKSLIQNISICIGRCGVIDSYKMSKYLERVIKPFCLSLRNVGDSPEKRDAFKGICAMIIVNPKSILNQFVFFCDAIISFEKPPDDIEKMFQDIIYLFNDNFNEDFSQIVNSFPLNLQQKMKKRFKM